MGQLRSASSGCASSRGGEHLICDDRYRAEEANGRCSAESGALISDVFAEQDALGEGAACNDESGFAPLSFEERVADILECINRKPSHREILYKTLCAVRVHLDEGELIATIEGFPEMATEPMPAAMFLNILEAHGALERQGGFVDGADGVGQSPNADLSAVGTASAVSASVDHASSALVAGAAASGENASSMDAEAAVPFSYSLTEAGAFVVDAMAPAQRLRTLFCDEPVLEPLLRDVLAFCAERPRTLPEVNSAFSSREELKNPKAFPSMLLDLLERSGGIEWKKEGWATTEMGKEC